MAKEPKYYQEKKEIQKAKYLQIKECLPECAIEYLDSKHKLTYSTKLAYANDLMCFFKYVCEADITEKSVKGITLTDIESYDKPFFDAYVNYLQEFADKYHSGNNRNSVERKLVPVRAMYLYYSNMGAIKINPLANYERFAEASSKTIVHLSTDEVHEVVSNVLTGDVPLTDRQRKYQEKSQLRDIAIIRLLLGTGIRVSECVGADYSALNFHDNSLYVIRKGDHSDKVYFNEEVAAALKDYIENERPNIKYKDDGSALFYSSHGTRISVDTVERIVARYTQEIPGKHITPHKLRSSYGTALYQATGDLGLVQDALGHASPTTTKKFYVNSREENMKKAAQTPIY